MNLTPKQLRILWSLCLLKRTDLKECTPVCDANELRIYELGEIMDALEDQEDALEREYAPYPPQ